MMRTLVFAVLFAVSLPGARGEEWAGRVFKAADSLSTEKEAEADAAACLEGLRWTPGGFEVVTEAGAEDRGDWLVRFPSPVPIGDAVNDRVGMEWRMARDADGKPAKGPAVVVVHESGRGMVAGRAFARGLCAKGVHTFLIHLPGYGVRTSERSRDMRRMLPALKQAVGDVRRARDAVAVLPLVEGKEIGVLGISLGGFVTSTVCGLDHGFDRNFILLAGGNLVDVLMNGERDAARFREQVLKTGITVEQMKEMSRVVEPMRLAKRVNAARTWMFSGSFDEVVPIRCSIAFAEAAGLAAENHQQFPAGHYTAAVFIPVIMEKVSGVMLGKVPAGAVK